MFHFGTNKERRETALTRENGFEVIGVVALIALLLLGFLALFHTLYVPYAPTFAIIVTALLIAGWITLRARRRREQLNKAVELRSKLSALEAQEFALKYELAKRSGQLDRWEKEK